MQNILRVIVLFLITVFLYCMFQHARIPFERLTPAVGPGSRNGDEVVLAEKYPEQTEHI